MSELIIELESLQMFAEFYIVMIHACRTTETVFHGKNEMIVSEKNTKQWDSWEKMWDLVFSLGLTICHSKLQLFDHNVEM